MNKYLSLNLTGLFLISSYSTVNAVDIIPGNAIAPPPKVNVFTATYSALNTGKQYINSKEQALDTKADASVIMLRYTRTFNFLDQPAAFYIQPSFGKVKPGGILASNNDSSGLGDTAFAFAYWPYSNRQAGSYFGTVAYLVTPTGEYDSNELINLGQNRYSGAFQIGYHTKLSRKLDLMAAADVQWFGDNNDYRLTHQKFEQKPLYSSQLSIMFNIDPKFMLAASYYVNRDGETALNGIDRNDQIDAERYQLMAKGKFDFGNLIFQYGSDLDRANGFFEEQRAFLRYQYVWK